MGGVRYPQEWHKQFQSNGIHYNELRAQNSNNKKQIACELLITEEAVKAMKHNEDDQNQKQNTQDIETISLAAVIATQAKAQTMSKAAEKNIR